MGKPLPHPTFHSPRLVRIPSFCLAALALCSALAGAANGQTWRLIGPMNSPPSTGVFTEVLEFYGTKGFAVCGRRLYRTEDFGENWVPLNNPDRAVAVRSLAMVGRNLFAGTWSGVYRSGDGGDSWTLLPKTSSFISVDAMFVHRGALLVFSRGTTQVFRYSDSGDAWTRIVVGAPNAPLTEITHGAADDSALYIGGKKLFKSLDGGTTWMDLTPGLSDALKRFQSAGFSYVRALLAGKGGLYVGVQHAIYRSADGGITWSPMLISDSESTFSTLALAGDTLMAGNINGGLWRIPLDQSLPTRVGGFRSIHTVRASDSGIFIGSETGIFRSVDAGKNFEGKTPAGSLQIGILTSKNGIMHAIGPSSLLYRSPDHGATWIPHTGLNELNWINSMTWNGNGLFAASFQGGNGIYESEDSGMTWTARSSHLDSIEFRLLTSSAGTLYAVLVTRIQTDVLVRSEDKGRSWRPASDKIGSGQLKINSLAFGEAWIHVGTDSGYFRIDAATGKVNASGLNGEYIRKLSALEGRLFASGNGTVIWRSQDQGLTWDKPAVAVPWVNYATDFAGHGDTFYAGTYGSGVYRSTNGGSSWEPFQAGYLDPKVSCLVLEGGRLYAGTSGSVFSLEVEGGVSVSGRRLESGKDRLRTGFLFEKATRLPYLEAIQRDGRFRIIRLDGREVADPLIRSHDGANR